MPPSRWRPSIETADMLVHEVLSRPMHDRKAVARYAGLTGSPDESGAKRREQGLARAGNARVRRGMIQLAWRFLRFQKQSALALWYQARTADPLSPMAKVRLLVSLAKWSTAVPASTEAVIGCHTARRVAPARKRQSEFFAGGDADHIAVAGYSVGLFEYI
jgi:hypothetical protein